MDFVMTNMIGHIICVRCKDGAIYEGILSAVNWTAGTKGLLLKQAKKILSRNDKAEKPKAEYTITREDFVSLATKADIDLYNDELTEAARRHGGAQGAGNAGQINRKVGVLIRCNRQTAFNPFMIVGRDDKLIGAGGKICIKAVGLADEISIQIPVDRC